MPSPLQAESPEVQAAYWELSSSTRAAALKPFYPIVGTFFVLTSCLIYPAAGRLRAGLWIAAYALYVLAAPMLRRYTERLGNTGPELPRSSHSFVHASLMGALALATFSSVSESVFLMLTLLVVFHTVFITTFFYAARVTHWAYMVLALGTFALCWFLTSHVASDFIGCGLIAWIGASEIAARSQRAGLLARARLHAANVRLAHDLAAQVETLDRLSRDKTSLLAAACHDLRQPAHAMGLQIAAILDMPEQADLRPHLHELQNSNATLVGMLSTLMDLTRLDSGSMDAVQTAVPLDRILEETRLQFQLEAARKSLRLEMHDTDLSVLSDPYLLRRIVFNLVSNAIKYTKQGKVALAIRKDGARIVLEISDTGIGIASQDHARVFEEYARLDRMAEGLGIGLSVVQRACRLLNHTLTLESRLHSGTTLSIAMEEAPTTMPVVPKSDATCGALPHRPSAGRVLVCMVEDHDAVRQSAQRLLEIWGYDVVPARSLDQLLQYLTEIGREPALIVSDLHVGSVNGFSVIHAVRSRPGLADLPALLVTGDLSQDVSRTARANNIRLLHKPVASVRLREAIDSLTTH